MRLTNDPEINKQIGAQLKPALKKSPDLEPRIAEAFWAVLSRPVREEEWDLFRACLGGRNHRPDAGLQQMVWVLPYSPEFRLRD